MEYSQGKIGRVFVLKFGHGDDLLAELEAFAEKEKLGPALVHLIGALDSAEMVVGPKRKILPPEPVWRKFDDARELVGTGTILLRGRKPSVHLHCVVGRKDSVNVGCIRKGGKVYIVVEAVVLEINGAMASRAKDAKSGMEILQIE